MNYILTVLNLVISGIPSILKRVSMAYWDSGVLNLVISGIPSIPENMILKYKIAWKF